MQIKSRFVALLQQNEQNLTETSQKMKKEVKFSKLDNVAKIIKVGNTITILQE